MKNTTATTTDKLANKAAAAMETKTYYIKYEMRINKWTAVEKTAEVKAKSREEAVIKACSPFDFVFYIGEEGVPPLNDEDLPF